VKTTSVQTTKPDIPRETQRADKGEAIGFFKMGILREGEAPAEPLCKGRSLLALLGRSLALPSKILSIFRNPIDHQNTKGS
jgi:hypothetical protein